MCVWIGRQILFESTPENWVSTLRLVEEFHHWSVLFWHWAALKRREMQLTIDMCEEVDRSLLHFSIYDRLRPYNKIPTVWACMAYICIVNWVLLCYTGSSVGLGASHQLTRTSSARQSPSSSSLSRSVVQKTGSQTTLDKEEQQGDITGSKFDIVSHFWY